MGNGWRVGVEERRGNVGNGVESRGGGNVRNGWRVGGEERRGNVGNGVGSWWRGEEG